MASNTDILRNIELFFKDPCIFRRKAGDTGTFGVLYFLRNEILDCLDHNIGIFPATLSILAGVDLLAKFYAGKDTRNEVKVRYESFINEYFKPISDKDKKTIYQLRNALVHSFGLYSEGEGGKKYRFQLKRALEPLVTYSSGDVCTIDVLTLHKYFNTAIERYHQDLVDDKDHPETGKNLREGFADMFCKYGTVTIGE
jgi:hypothetical protein